MKTIQHYAMMALMASGAMALPLVAANANDYGTTTTSSAASSFKSMDKDKSGSLSETEYDATTEAVPFKQADSNGDGKVSSNEFKTAMASAPQDTGAPSSSSYTQ